MSSTQRSPHKIKLPLSRATKKNLQEKIPYCRQCHKMHLSILLGFSTLWGTTNGANDLFTPQSLWEARKVNNKHQMWVGIQDLTQRRFLSWCPKAEEQGTIQTWEDVLVCSIKFTPILILCRQHSRSEKYKARNIWIYSSV